VDVYETLCLLGLLFNPEDRLFLCDVSELPPDYTSSHPQKIVILELILTG
jgi:hypothetical protein